MKSTKFLIVAAGLFVASAPAFAQMPPQSAAQQPVPNPQDVMNLLVTDLQRVANDAAALSQTYQISRAILDDYLKKCGDKPGCTQPIEAAPKKP